MPVGCRSVSALVTVLAFATTAPAQLTVISRPAGTVGAIGGAMSHDGQVVVGTYRYTSILNQEAFRWTASGGTIGLGDFPGGHALSFATAVSADGSIVAGTGYTESGAAAFRWTAAGGLVTSGGTGINGLSDNGQVAVGSTLVQTSSSIRVNQAYRHTLSGGQVLGSLGSQQSSTAHAVSADGGIVVGASDFGAGRNAFRWSAATGNMASLGDLPGGGFHDRSEAYGVSRNGNTVVGYGTGDQGDEAFIWTTADGMVGLGDLPGGTFASYAYAVTDDGTRVVGTGRTAAGDTAFIWDAGVGMRNLADVATAQGIDLGAYRLTTATDITPDGRFVAGTAADGAGNTFVYRMQITPVPEPGSVLAAVAVGWAMVRAVRRRAAVTPGNRKWIVFDADRGIGREEMTEYDLPELSADASLKRTPCQPPTRPIACITETFI